MDGWAARLIDRTAVQAKDGPLGAPDVLDAVLADGVWYTRSIGFEMT